MRDEMDHPNTIRLIEWFSSSTSYYLVFELATGGDLIDRINGAGEKLNWLITVFSLTALQAVTSVRTIQGRLSRRSSKPRVTFTLATFSTETSNSTTTYTDLRMLPLVKSSLSTLARPCSSLPMTYSCSNRAGARRTSHQKYTLLEATPSQLTCGLLVLSPSTYSPVAHSTPPPIHT